MSATHRLLFAGEPLPGIDPALLRQVLIERLKLTAPQAEAIFSGKLVSLKSFTDGQEAERYRARLAEMGARVWVEAVTPPKPAAAPAPERPAEPSGRPTTAAPAFQAPAAPTVEEIDCPNCGERQPKRTLCRKCAADMPRVLAAKQQEEQEARKAALEAGRGRGIRPQERAPERLAYETPPLFGWGLGGRIGRVTYLLGNIAMTAIVLPIVVLGLKLGRQTVMWTLLVLSGILCLRLTALRCNDLGWSRWFALIQLVPVAGVGFTLLLLIVPGERTENAQGLPTPISGWVPLGFCLLVAAGSAVTLWKEMMPLLMSFAAAQARAGQATHPVAARDPAPIPEELEVVMYSDGSCEQCATRRQELAKAGIPYQEVSLDADPAAQARLQEAVFRSGLDGTTICTPILELNGIVLPNGVGVPEIQALLAQVPQ